jgi:hypothetical protein
MYEQGRTAPSCARLVSLAHALGISPAALLIRLRLRGVAT